MGLTHVPYEYYSVDSMTFQIGTHAEAKSSGMVFLFLESSM
ncbi:MAG: hypothetical protein ACOYIK_06010 [Coriobacteriales bacterium]